MTVLFLCLLLFSFLGYALFLSRRVHIPTEFIPLLIVSGCISLLFFAGLFNILPYAAWALLLLGIAALADSMIRKDRCTALKKLITPGSMLILILFCIFAVVLRDGRLVHYDNFSHWALIVKQMTLDDRLPNFTNTYITFQSYPPGSALFLYYISKFTGYHENIVIFIQAAMTTAAVLPIFAFIPKMDKHNKKISLWKLLCTVLSFSGCMLLTLGCNVEIYSLLVDALLPAMAAGMAVVALYYRDQPCRAALLTLPVSVATLLIKNTGLLFVAIHFILILCLWLHSKKQSKSAPRTGLPILLHAIVPACVQLLWSRHVALVFQAAGDAKHTMSAEHYSNVFADKSPTDIQNIVQTFLHRIFDFSENPTLTAMLIINLVLIAALLLHILFIKKHVGLIAGTLLLLDGIYAIYSVGLLAMYLFSMPTGEALYLASFDRYIYTILIYLLIPFALCMAYLLTESRGAGVAILGCLLLISITSIVFIQREPLQNNLLNSYPNSRVSTIDTALGGQGGLPSAAVYCPASAGDGGYTLYCMRYKLMTDNIAYLYSMPSLQDMQSLIEQCEYLIVIDVDDAVSTFLKDAGIANPKPGVYTAQELLPEE